ncbi:GNAT family N-acetyltransferase [Chishuiella sp.]|uniref:GNAT family N-acetyltransferase n=1 Tax=Chishuiella sp. TaxID=1969467 RepID=UPI0028A8D61D|nr:GNAT family N-acetyltransferase [Chishuiella sp.]
MEFIKTDNGKKGAFSAIDGDKKAGEMTYTWAGDNKIIIDHTEVDETYGGQGIGKKILVNILDWVRKDNIKVIPLCPFAKAQFEKNEDFRDVLA